MGRTAPEDRAVPMKRLAIFLDGDADDRDALASAALLAEGLQALSGRLSPGLRSILRALINGGDALVLDPRADGADVGGRAAFEATFAKLPHARWIEVPDGLDDTIHHFGILYDAIIVARLTEEQGPHAGAFNTALFEVGAPVLVTPSLAPARLGHHVALVWTRTPQSARAMRSAVALLQRADEVHVLTNSANDLAAPGEALDYLAVQGVWANALSFDGASLTARGWGRAIMVMGAFGEQSTDALFGLGRNTRKLVTAAPVALLLRS